MKRKRYLLAGALLLIVALLFSQRGSIHRLALGLVQKELRKAGVMMTLQKPALSFIGLTADEADMTIPKVPFPLPLRDLDLQVSPMSLTTLEPKVILNTELYEGKVEATAKKGANAARGRVTITKLQLADNPMLAGFGLQSGLLSARVPQFQSQGNKHEFDFTLKIEEFSKPYDTPLAPALTGLPLKITLPGFEDGTIAGTGNMNDKTLKINSFSFESSLGKISLSGYCSQSRSGPIDIKGTVSLTQIGQEKVGSFLPLLSLGKLRSTDTNFEFHTSGRVGQPRAFFKSLS